MSQQWVARGPARSAIAVFLVAAITLVVLGGPAPRPADLAVMSPAGAAPPGPPLVVEGDVVRTYTSDPDGVHVDPWVVWVCVLEPGGSITERLPITAEDVVEALDEEIAPYFEWLSRGDYQPTYTAGGSIDSGTNDPDDAIGTCLPEAVASPVSAGFAGALVILNAPYEDAVGESGHQACPSPPCTASTTLPGNQRTIQLGAHDLFTTTTIGTPWLAETAHEFGHTLDWGHAGPDPSYRVHEPGQDGYVPTAADAPWLDGIDPAVITALDAVIEANGFPSIESDRAALGSKSVDCNTIMTEPTTTAGWSLCLLLSVLAYGGLYDVMGTDPSPLTPDTDAIPQTQAFNRYAAGWIDDTEIVTHTGGYQEYEVSPLDVDGTQMLVLPLSDPSTYVMVEARRPTPFLPGDENSGVLVNVVDQRPDSCGGETCWGDSDWKTMAYDGEPWNRAQLFDVGDRTTVDGTPVEVVSVDADGRYTIRVGEPPVDPGPAPAPVVHRPLVATPVFRQPSFTG